VLAELAARTGLIWRYPTELGIRASCTAVTPTITTDAVGRAGDVCDVWTDDGELDHLCPVALIAMIGTKTETAEHPEKLLTIHDNASEHVHGVKGAEKLLVMAAEGEPGAATMRRVPDDCRGHRRGSQEPGRCGRRAHRQRQPRHGRRFRNLRRGRPPPPAG